MEKHPLKCLRRGLLCLPMILMLSSCSGTDATLSVLRGNLLFRGGEDTLATYMYIQADQRAGEWEDWIDYDLGTLYVSLGEINPGIRVLSRTLEGFGQLPDQPNRRDRELFFRSYFNLGIARYESGRYREATADFVQALRLKPDSWDAKINLELSIAAMMKAAASARVQSAASVPESGQNSQDTESEQLLQTIHREELPGWVSAPSQDVFEQDW